MQYWLVKSEPESYGIEHLKKDKQTPWTGVRNFTARNYLREMRPGDKVLFYHSSCAVPGVYGLAEVASLSYPDPTQFDPNSPYYDKRATKEKPLWDLVDIKYVKTLERPVTLSEIRKNKKLQGMQILAKGNRLSVITITKVEYEEILRICS